MHTVVETEVFIRVVSEIWLLMVYVKARFDNLPTSFLNQLREAIDHG